MIVIDASIAVSWFFEDEHDELVIQTAHRVLNESALVPPIFPAEIANALLFAFRRGRIPERAVREAIEHVAQLPIRIDSAGFLLQGELALARQYQLTLYDAMYLALARRHRIALFTCDEALRRAASAEKLTVGG